MMQLPQARLVARRWLVRPAQELARKHRHHARCSRRNHSYGVERQRGEGAQIQDARGMSAEYGLGGNGGKRARSLLLTLLETA